LSNPHIPANILDWRSLIGSQVEAAPGAPQKSPKSSLFFFKKHKNVSPITSLTVRLDVGI
jgi:hypothetical protein